MGMLEKSPSANLDLDHDHIRPPSPATGTAPPLPPAPHSHANSSLPADDHQPPTISNPPTDDHDDDDGDIEKIPAVDFPPQPSDSHAPPPSNQPESATVRRQPVEDVIDSAPAVAYPPQHGVQFVEALRPNNPGVVTAPPPLQEGGGSVVVPVVPRPPSRKTPFIIIPLVGNPWNSGLFDCCQHPTNAIITTVAPCATFGQIAEIVDNGSTSCLAGAMLYVVLFLVLCHWNIGVRYRKRVRDAYQLAETPVTDRIAHAMFPLCALCQEFRELKHQGYDPFLGYKGVVVNLQTMSGIPPQNQVMMR